MPGGEFGAIALAASSKSFDTAVLAATAALRVERGRGELAAGAPMSGDGGAVGRFDLDPVRVDVDSTLPVAGAERMPFHVDLSTAGLDPSVLLSAGGGAGVPFRFGFLRFVDVDLSTTFESQLGSRGTC